MDKSKALDAALSQIERHFGKGSIMRLGKRDKVDIDTIPSGSLGLDIALGIGGLPRGRVVEIYGPESSGKTTLALHAIAERPRSRCMPLRKRKSAAALAPSSTPSTPWMPPTRASSGSISTIS